MGTGNEFDHERDTEEEIKLVKDGLNREKEMEIKYLRKERDHWLDKVCDMKNERFHNRMVMAFTTISYLFFRFILRN